MMQPFPVTIEVSGIDRFVQLSTIILSVFTIFLWLATANLVRVSRKSMRHDLKAYISFKDFAFGQLLGANNSPFAWTVNVIWQNTGKTFTQNMHNQIFLHVLTSTQEHPVEFPSITGLGVNDLPTISVSPGTAMGGGKQVILVTDLQLAKSGTRRIFIRGWAQYGDIFKPEVDAYRSEFCFEIFCDGDPLQAPCQFSYTFHSSHNRTDAEISPGFERIHLN